MKKVFTLLTITCFAYAANAQQLATTTAAISAVSPDAVKAVDAATIKAVEEALVLKETTFSFGKIPQGKPVTHVFEVTNTGKTAFKLDNVQASCGCTTPMWDKDAPIAPGATAKITVGYNAAAEGPFTKVITITYNGSSSKQVTISGEVWKTPVTSAPENNAANDLKN
jgi:hypothetical protein